MGLPVILSLSAAGCAMIVACIALFGAPRSIAALVFAAGMLACAISTVIEGLAQSSSSPAQAARYYSWSMIAWAVAMAIWLFFSLVYARGNYKVFVSRWKWAGVFACAVPLLLVATFPQGFVSIVTDFNTFASLLRLNPPGLLFQSSLLLSSLLILTNLEHTFRAAVGTIRWRIKYVVIGLGVLFGVKAYTICQVLLYRSIDPFLTTVNELALALSCLLVLRSLFRAGQWAAVTYPTKTVFLNSVTFLLAGAYLLIVGVIAKVMVWLGSATSFQTKGLIVLVSVALGAVVALSDRVRLRLRRLTSHYLQKPLYDYRAVWRSFTEGLTSQMNEEQLCDAAIKLVARIFELLSVSVWLIDERRENFVCVASTSVSKDAARDLQPWRAEAAEVIREFAVRHEPRRFEREEAPWAAALRKCHPPQFARGGDRVCVPLAAGGALLGVMLLGDRVAGLNFSFQEFDLLHCVGDQMAASLLNARLSKRLLQNKEMEAFQAMSTFFVHDLKNLASTLNLMLKNLPVHFDNPEFRADALRGIGKTCDHINHLISRLSLLRESLQIRPLESDLNKVVAAALSNCPPAAGVEVIQQLPPLPKVMLDAEQIDKVITNLALNAIEAVPAGGSISVQTSQTNGWAVVTVSDTGCGMAPEFVNDSLFRPFQTTKKKGLGIGMFQSKMIVEAHGGRIEVESKRGHGSTFRVLLPMQQPGT
jgi:putative PEP-CTERM system histidine kinase